jgi:hypothetical protein
MDSFRKEIRDDQLPQTFRDAFTFTRALTLSSSIQEGRPPDGRVPQAQMGSGSRSRVTGPGRRRRRRRRAACAGVAELYVSSASNSGVGGARYSWGGFNGPPLLIK